MRLNICIGGRAGQGINLISQIVSKVMASQGYFTFNYRDYPSIIRGGHNYNILSISDTEIQSHESKLDGIVAMDDNTLDLHKKDLKKHGFTIAPDQYLEFGINLNVALAGALMKILGVERKILDEFIKKRIKESTKEALKAADTGFESQEKKHSLEKLKNKIEIKSGSEAVAEGAINSHIDLYIAYPMTPATPVLHLLAAKQEKNGHMVFQPENEIAVANMALGASFAGARTMIGTSGGGFDLMTETLSLQGISEIPLVAYLSSRVGPGTGVPTYSMQGDLGIALYGGHGEFPRIVIAPGTPTETIEKTNEAFYLSEQFGALTVLLSDKHLAESQYSLTKKPAKPLNVKITRKVPGEKIVKATSYEHDDFGNTTEDASITQKKGDIRKEKYEKIKKACQKFQMTKTHGKEDSKNLIIGWGSTAGAIKDAIKGLDCKFLQILYVEPLSGEIEKEIKKAEKVIIVENNLTGQLSNHLTEQTGIKIENKILKYNNQPFLSDELHEQIKKELK